MKIIFSFLAYIVSLSVGADLLHVTASAEIYKAVMNSIRAFNKNTHQCFSLSKYNHHCPWTILNQTKISLSRP